MAMTITATRHSSPSTRNGRRRCRVSPDISGSLEPKNLEHRACLELRAEQSKIVGYAVVFDVRSRDLGGFVEVVKPEACRSTVVGDVVCLFNHDSNQVLGRTPATLQLRTDSRGLAFTLDPANTT